MATGFTLQALPAVFYPDPRDLEASDKAILPDQVLWSILASHQGALPASPMIFHVRNLAFDNSSHCGVLEFSSAAPDNAYLPQWMMDNLMLEPGTCILVHLVSLPRLTYARLQPVRYAFTEIPDPKAALELALGRFTCLTQGDTVHVQVAGTVHQVVVTAVRPDSGDPPAGCVVDTNLTIEFDEPLEQRADPSCVTLELGAGVRGTCAPDGFAYYMVKHTRPDMALRVACTPASGLPDLYVSSACSTPAPHACEWSYATSLPGNPGLTVAPDTPRPWFYIAVHSFREPADFTLSVSLVSPPAIAVPRAAAPDTPQGTVCDNCLRPVPAAALTMHSMRCARSNWRCATCAAVLPVSQQSTHWHCPQCAVVVHSALEVEKHQALVHAEVECPCGLRLPRQGLAPHQEHECVLRGVPCKYCGISTRATDRADHEAMCGGRTDPCEQCGVPVPRKKMSHHMAVVHRVNPSAGLQYTPRDRGPSAALDVSNFGNLLLEDGDQENFYSDEDDWGDEEDDEMTTECPFCEQSFPVEEISYHVSSMHDLD